MATPPPFSFTTLDTFMTCPRQYYHKYVIKVIPYKESEEMLWGKEVHTAFENFVQNGTPLPPAMRLDEHYDYLKGLRQRPGIIKPEEKCGLSIKLEPVGFFAPDVWCRMVIDYRCIDGAEHHIVDYKTGKVRPKPMQLHLNMLHSFAMGAEMVRAEFYWTQTKSSTKIVFPRSHAKVLVHTLRPIVAEYAQAHRLGVWRPKPNGLCNGWCEVTECEHWKKRRT